MTQKTFNLNSSIKVKLLGHAFDIWHNTYKILPEHNQPSIEELKAKADKDGYHTFQAWDFMATFGSQFEMGCIPPCELFIKINESDLLFNTITTN